MDLAFLEEELPDMQEDAAKQLGPFCSDLPR